MVLLSPELAVVLMLAGVGPVFVSVYLLRDDWRKPGVLWFLAAMVTGGIWALLYSLITLIPDPGITKALGHVFWPTITTAAITMFLLAYEFVFKNTTPRILTVALFTPVVVLFLLAWVNPYDLVYTDAYYVDAQGFLHFPLIGGPLRFLIVQCYGYLLVFLAAGMFVGEAIRTTGVQRRQALYLLLVFSTLVATTIIKLAGFLPIYYDLTSTTLAFSGVLFAHSIHKHGLLKFVPVAREHTFEEVQDAILVVDQHDTILDANRSARRLFHTQLTDTPLQAILNDTQDLPASGRLDTHELEIDGDTHYFTVTSTPIAYGRGVQGRIVALSDITAIKERERELNLLKEILSRMFRHNIRNDISIIQGYADLIHHNSTGERQDWAGRIQATADQLHDQTQKVQTIETVITHDDTTTSPLPEIIADALEQHRHRRLLYVERERRPGLRGERPDLLRGHRVGRIGL